MSRVCAALCGGLLLGLVVPLAPGQALHEKSKDPATLSSRPVRVNGVDFQVVADPVWRRPAKIYGIAGASIGLRISNRSDRELTFDLAGALRVGLKAADGAELVSGSIHRRFLPKPIRIAAGKSETITLPTHLFHTRIREVCLGLESDAGWNWLTHDIQPGKYRLCLYYENKQRGSDAWLGQVQTDMLEIAVTAAR
jgi:hypothetical protein